MRLLIAAFALLFAVSGLRAESLQALVDATDDGGEILLEADTVYDGPVVIDRPVVIDGQGSAVIDGGLEGTVVIIASDGVTLKNLTIRNSGRLHNKLDAGLKIQGNYNVVRDVRIENSLFGIDQRRGTPGGRASIGKEAGGRGGGRKAVSATGKGGGAARGVAAGA